jgi:GT2 family glycosyltransferase
MIDLSVIVPTHNRQEFLAALLESMAAQDYPRERWELIIVDDGSIDGTLEYLNSDPQPAPYNTWVVAQPQRGAATARNTGAMMARGDALLFLDDDMIVQPTLVSAHVRAHQRDDRAVVIGHVLVPDEGRDPWVAWEDTQMGRHFNALASGDRKPGPRDFYSGNCSVSTVLFYDVSGYDTDLPRTEDVDLGYRLQEAGARFYYAPQAGSIHLGHHTYQSWVRNACLYGTCDVTLGWEKGHTVLQTEIFRWFTIRQALTRGLVRMCSDRPSLEQPSIGLLHVLGRTAYRIKLRKLSDASYSAIYNLAYWMAVIDGIGPQRFWAGVQSQTRGGQRQERTQVGALQTVPGAQETEEAAP